MAQQQDYEMVKALKDIAYELKRIADAIDEAKKQEKVTDQRRGRRHEATHAPNHS